MKIKFVFYLKSGSVFETVAEMTPEEFETIVNTIIGSFQTVSRGYISLGTSIINLNECAVVDWEEL